MRPFQIPWLGIHGINRASNEFPVWYRYKYRYPALVREIKIINSFHRTAEAKPFLTHLAFLISRGPCCSQIHGSNYKSPVLSTKKDEAAAFMLDSFKQQRHSSIWRADPDPKPKNIGLVSKTWTRRHRPIWKPSACGYVERYSGRILLEWVIKSH